MDIYLIIVIILFVAAAIDLVVGVSNDAVNFLNSAIGSKVASMKVILIIATLGILAGSFFSSGIMEVARKGIFNPEFYTFDMIMYLFLAVMLTDIILLDVFNTIGLPTSTTVSIVFELLGAATMVGLLMTINKGEGLDKVGQYINGKSAMKIVSGIFLSIIFAFSFGAIAQYLSRLLMSFDFEKNLKRFGGLFAGIAITSISYFLVIKGLKGSPLKGSDFYNWVTGNTWTVVAGLFVFFTILSQLLMMFAKVNPLRVVVLTGTFALAMAFAGNDLVNFIGVPIAGYEAYQAMLKSGEPANQFTMEVLSGKVTVKLIFLLASGVIMALALWFSSKARKVTETEVNLGRQDEGDERFKPNAVSRAIVKTALGMSKISKALLPASVANRIEGKFSQKNFEKAVYFKKAPAFDLVRASVNLMMASIVISYATSKKMPLSTTYVSFMVAMGTSLADRAWGRESAVYRVAGVLSVIGGWLMTAVIAFTTAAIFALLLVKFQMWAVVGLVVLAIAALVSSHLKFKESSKNIKEQELNLADAENVEELLSNSVKLTSGTLKTINNSYSLSMKALASENIEMLQLSDERMDKLVSQGFKVRSKAIKAIKQIDTDDLTVGRLYLMASDLLQDITTSAKFLTDEPLHYIQNLHRSPSEEFKTTIGKLETDVSDFLAKVQSGINELDFSKSDEIIQQRKDIRAYINDELHTQVERIQIEGMSTKQAILETELLLQSRDIIAVALRLYKHYRNFADPNYGE